MSLGEDWKDLKEEDLGNPDFRCHKCGDRSHLQEREWESSDGAYTDYNYRCLKCGSSWWVEGADY